MNGYSGHTSGWMSDTYRAGQEVASWFSGGGDPTKAEGGPSGDDVKGTVDDKIYQFWRNVGPKDQYWRIPVTSGEYTVQLGFADMLSGGAGIRLLDAWIEDRKHLSSFDAYKAAGAKAAIVKAFKVNVTDGELTIRLLQNPNSTAYAFINNIAVLPGGGGDHIPPAVATNQAILKGKTDGEKLTIDGRNVPLDAQGRFQHIVPLSSASKTVEMKAQKDGVTTTKQVKVQK